MKHFFIILSMLAIGFIVYTYVSQLKNGKSLDEKSNSMVNTAQAPLPAQQSYDGEFCFTYLKEDTQIYDKRTIKLVINTMKVKGEKTGSYRSTEYSVGYNALLNGVSTQEGLIDVVSNSSISDGGKQNQEERYEFKNNQLTELTYAYKEDFLNNILRIDESKKDNGQGLSFPLKTLYSKVPCN